MYTCFWVLAYVTSVAFSHYLSTRYRKPRKTACAWRRTVQLSVDEDAIRACVGAHPHNTGVCKWDWPGSVPYSLPIQKTTGTANC